ncbi:HEAT repeat domain-containing protein [Kitasatospora sp. NPDC048298]|uniref:HEAT repeat domain-containing protein n=1 Tax=Kitasatospora sp. NPDC048298 TaxID=3364049 RepID=UPI0037191F34
MREDHADVEQVSLGGLTVRAGHGAVPTELEWRFSVLTPVDELVARAVRHRDGLHVGRSACLFVLGERRSRQAWSALMAHHRHPDPAHRRFVAGFLLDAPFLRQGGPVEYEGEETELIAAWTSTEPDDEVLATLLGALDGREYPDAEAIGLRHAGHPDPRVRRTVPNLLGAPLTGAGHDCVLRLTRDPDASVRSAAARSLGDARRTPETRAALLALTGDESPDVQGAAVSVLAGSADRTPELADALAALLGADDRQVRLEAGHGLALRDDPRTATAVGLLGPLTGPESEHDHRVSTLRGWARRRRDVSRDVSEGV